MLAVSELIKNLDQLVTVYRHLLDIVRKENEVLAQADLQEIPKVHEAKEKLVHHVRRLDEQWQLAAKQLSQQLNLKTEHPTLLELSSYVHGKEKKKMEQLHSVLNMLVQRISEWNKKNDQLVKSALAHITGAMDSIAKTLNENPTYKNSGSMEAANNEAQGRLVCREA